MKSIVSVLIRLLAFTAGLLAIAVSAAGMSHPPAQDEIRITLEQAAGAKVHVTYETGKPRRALLFTEVQDGYRLIKWEIVTPGFRIVQDEDGDKLYRPDGQKFDRVELIARPAGLRLPKEYQPLSRYGEGGVLVYSGHFWPVTKDGDRQNATFSFYPADGGEVVAFGDRAPKLENWRSPMAHPAFVYMGPLAPMKTKHLMAVVDPEAPEWITEEFYSLVPKAFDYLKDAFGFAPNTKPNLFLAVQPGGEEGRLSYAGDALPAQFQITLEGGGWNKFSVKGQDIFRRSTIHEAVHLWQAAAAQPVSKDDAEWIHEGSADAIAVEAMIALGYWGASDLANFEKDARSDCVAGLKNGPLSGAGQRGDYTALYACGYLIAMTTAETADTTAADFWRGFMDRAGSDGEYSQHSYYDYVEETAQNRNFPQALRYFVRTPLANPDREIRRLMAEARAASDASPLAPSGGD